MLAISFMNDILVASIAFATYFVISDDLTSIKTNLSWFITNDEYNSFNVSKTSSFSAPITILSGCMQSSIALPSFRNSGLEAISIFTSLLFSFRIFSMCSFTLNPVPIGTVDFITTNESFVMLFAMSVAAENM